MAEFTVPSKWPEVRKRVPFYYRRESRCPASIAYFLQRVSSPKSFTILSFSLSLAINPSRHTSPPPPLSFSFSLSLFPFEFRCSSFVRHTFRFIDREVRAIFNFTALGNAQGLNLKDSIIVLLYSTFVSNCVKFGGQLIQLKPPNLHYSRNILFRSWYKLRSSFFLFCINNRSMEFSQIFIASLYQVPRFLKFRITKV